MWSTSGISNRIGFVFAILAAAAPRAFAETQPAAPAVPGPETTRIEAPLDADGRVDFPAYVRSLRRAAPKRADNALFDYARAIGPKLIIPAHQQAVLGWMKLPAEGNYITSPPAGEAFQEQYDRAQAGPYKPGTLPLAEAWIAKAERPLAHVLAGAEKPTLYWPALPDPDRPATERFPTDMTLNRGMLRCMAYLLIARANGHFGAGRYAAGVADTHAVLRLAEQTSQEHTLGAAVVAEGIEELGLLPIVGVATSGQLPAAQAERLAADLATRADLVACYADALDRAERAKMLDTLYRAHVEQAELTVVDVAMAILAQNSFGWGMTLLLSDGDLSAGFLQKLRKRCLAAGPQGRPLWEVLEPAMKALAAKDVSLADGRLASFVFGSDTAANAPAEDNPPSSVPAAAGAEVDWACAMQAFNRSCDALVALGRSPRPETWRKLRDLRDSFESSKASTAALLAPVVLGDPKVDPQTAGRRVGEAYAMVHGPAMRWGGGMMLRHDLRVARAKLLCHLAAYRARCGCWPATLDDLPAKDNPAKIVPTTGKPFRYNRTADGFELHPSPEAINTCLE